MHGDWFGEAQIKDCLFCIRKSFTKVMEDNCIDKPYVWKFSNIGYSSDE